MDWPRWSCTPEADGVTRTTRTPAGSLLAVDAGTPRLAGMNRHGDLAYTFSADGSVVGSAVYDPWGQPAGSAGAMPPTVGFQTDYTDPTSGEVWMGARWYQPDTGVFTSRDTYAGELATPVTLNRYTYAVNNPLAYFDPDGRRVIASTDLQSESAGDRAISHELERSHAQGRKADAEELATVGRTAQKEADSARAEVIKRATLASEKGLHTGPVGCSGWALTCRAGNLGRGAWDGVYGLGRFFSDGTVGCFTYDKQGCLDRGGAYNDLGRALKDDAPGTIRRVAEGTVEDGQQAWRSGTFEHWLAEEFDADLLLTEGTGRVARQFADGPRTPHGWPRRPTTAYRARRPQDRHPSSMTRSTPVGSTASCRARWC